MRVRGLYINTHAGQAIRQGGLAWALDKYHPHFTVLAEVGREPVRARVRRGFPNDRYSITGLDPQDEHLLVKSGTLIIAKRKILKVKWRENTLLSKQRFYDDGSRDKWHPIRRKTRARFVFRENPDVDFEIGADHAWTHAGHRLFSNHEVPTEHRRQIQSYAHSMRAASAEGRACVDIGDMNEGKPREGKNFAMRQFDNAGAELLVAAHLDYVFGNDRVELEDAAIIPKWKVRTDHPGLIFDLKVRD